MLHMWLYSVCQCVLSLCVMGVSVRLCLGGSRAEGVRGASVTTCLSLCLGWVGAVGGAVGVPVAVLLNLRSPQCLYTCVILVCCPLLVRHFTVSLLVILTVNAHLQLKLDNRYSILVTRKRVLCLVLICWVGSVLSTFGQFFICDPLDTWTVTSDVSGPGLNEVQNINRTTGIPPQRTSDPRDHVVIRKYLPHGGFWSTISVVNLQNVTYTNIYSSHWEVCAPDIVFSLGSLVYVYFLTAFVIPMLILLGVYADLRCAPSNAVTWDLQKSHSRRSNFVGLSVTLLVFLNLPLYTIQALRLFAPSTYRPVWASTVASILFQIYGLVPPLLFDHTSSNRGIPLPGTSHLPKLAITGAQICNKTKISPRSPEARSI
ncbi:adenosine receptor A1 [Chanos chanos]|uniref:Adenosine receptor A1 n=1 Tax=Chanos chanos TaxID=29144 RepID=A0A6J2W710_CHACN|nr:adenosine receptor A1-like [Chanos chanos]